MQNLGAGGEYFFPQRRQLISAGGAGLPAEVGVSTCARGEPQVGQKAAASGTELLQLLHLRKAFMLYLLLPYSYLACRARLPLMTAS
jgi:hypothetical protein